MRPQESLVAAEPDGRYAASRIEDSDPTVLAATRTATNLELGASVIPLRTRKPGQRAIPSEDHAIERRIEV